MNNTDRVKKPVGQIGIVLHKGGEYDPKTGKIINGEIIAEKNIDNLIVEDASKLMASRMAPDGLSGGLKYLAVGKGASNWDKQNPPPATIKDNKLQDEFYRKPFTSWSFVSGDADSPVPTNTLKLVTTFMDAEATGAIVEMGLFGGDAATSSANTGIMFNYKTFPVWNKPAETRLTITWKLTF